MDQTDPDADLDPEFQSLKTDLPLAKVVPFHIIWFKHDSKFIDILCRDRHTKDQRAATSMRWIPSGNLAVVE